MTVWRMAFRVGSGGYEMWPNCLKFGVAAITYDALANTDLSKYPKREPKNLWARLNTSQQPSLARLAYEMKKGDTIYVRQGKRIVGRGRVTGGYQFDYQNRIREKDAPNGLPWSHQVPVKWEPDFVEIGFDWNDRLTLVPLQDDVVAKLKTQIEKAKSSRNQADALEGGISQGEVKFRQRNAALIYAKKLNSNYTCEVCGFRFLNTYGDLGKGHIVAHHLVPLSSRSKPSITTLTDIALVCDNCHSMLHKRSPIPYSIADLKKFIK